MELTFPAAHRGRLNVLVNEHGPRVAAIDNRRRLQVVEVLFVDVDGVVLEDAKLDTLFREKRERRSEAIPIFHVNLSLTSPIRGT